MKEAIHFIQQGDMVSQVDHHIITYIGHLQEKMTNFVFKGRSTSRQHLVTSKKINATAGTNNNNKNSLTTVGYVPPSNKQPLWTDKNVLIRLHKRLIQAQTNAVSASLRWRGVIDNIINLEVRMKD